jgi:hypothetical protein
MREIRLWLGQFDDRKLEQILRANVAGIMGPNNRVAARLEGEKAGDYEFSGREDAIEQLVSLGFSHSYSPGQLEARASEELRLQRLYTGGTEGDQGPSAGSS